MVDLWQILGRMVTDDAFRADLYTIPVGYYPLDPTRPALAIPSDMYDTARAKVAAVMNGPVSLMALGELLMILSSKTFRDMADTLIAAIAATGVATAGRSSLFYTALGAMLLDDSVRAVFFADGFDEVQFDALLPAERTDLITLADPAIPVAAQADATCALFWLPRCHDKLNFYVGHTHPLANPLP